MSVIFVSVFGRAFVLSCVLARVILFVRACLPARFYCNFELVFECMFVSVHVGIRLLVFVSSSELLWCFFFHVSECLCVPVCVCVCFRAFVRAGKRACVRASLRACESECVCVSTV